MEQPRYEWFDPRFIALSKEDSLPKECLADYSYEALTAHLVYAIKDIGEMIRRERT